MKNGGSGVGVVDLGEAAADGGNGGVVARDGVGQASPQRIHSCLKFVVENF